MTVVGEPEMSVVVVCAKLSAGAYWLRPIQRGANAFASGYARCEFDAVPVPMTPNPGATAEAIALMSITAPAPLARSLVALVPPCADCEMP